MKITVCELGNDPEQLAADWEALARHVRDEASELVLLPEMPFFRWLAVTKEVDDALWAGAVAAHERWLTRLGELSPAVVIGSRPVTRGGKKLNEGFVWSAEDGYRAAHDKYYLPNEPGFWEATWYERGEKTFTAVEAGNACIGLAICSELWFLEHARAYGKQGADLIVTPRCGGKSVEGWLIGGRAAAVVAGAYSLSSNRNGTNELMTFGGQGWIVDPNGTVLGTTSREQPFLTLDVDLNVAREAKQSYPRYIAE